VAVAADHHFDSRVRIEIAGGLANGGGCVRAKFVAVVVEEDVLDVLVEGGFAAHVRVPGWRGRGDGDADCDANTRFGRSTVAFCGEMEVGGVGGGDSLGAVEVD